MLYYDVRAIKKLADDAESFYEFYKEWIGKVEIKHALSLLKISSLYYNRFSEQSEEDYTLYFGRCIYQLLVHFPVHRDLILKTENECRTIHLAYNIFFRRIRVMEKRYYKILGGDYKVNAFLIFSEISMGIICSLLKNIPSERLDNIFPVVIRIDGLPLSENITPQDMKSVSMIFDQISSYTGNIFRELRNLNILDLEHDCSELAVKNTGSWLKEWDDFDSLNRISDLFRFCNAEFSYSDLNNTSLIVDEHCAYKAYEIARSRFSMRGTSLFYEIQQILTENPNFVEQMKPFVPEWVNKRDFFSIAYFSEMENMSPEDLYIEYGGVNIYSWIHAYEMLIELAKEEMDNRFKKTVPGGLKLKDWVISHTRDEWVRFFVNGGLSWTIAALVTDYFTFDDKALDINDCPLLSCGDSLFLIPSIVSMSCATRSLLSLFSAKNITSQDKGKSHERQFIQRLKNAGLCAEQLSLRKNYECDCAMLIDDHLFFIELKSHGHPIHFNRYYQTLVNIHGDSSELHANSSWIKQVTRYADFYSNQLDLVRDALKLPKKWTPKGIHKMIITTSVFGDIYHQKDCYVIDKTSFYSFVERLSCTTIELRNGMKTIIKPESAHLYHGEITIDKMMAFLNTLPSISIKRRRVQQLTYHVQCGKLKLTYPFFDIWPALEEVLDENGSEAIVML